MRVSFDPAELEQELCRIPEVFAARVVGNGGGPPGEVRVLASAERPPKRVRRDVQSVAMASFGVEIDSRAISVTQLEKAATPSTPPGLQGVESLASVFDAPGGLPGGRPASEAAPEADREPPVPLAQTTTRPEGEAAGAADAEEAPAPRGGRTGEAAAGAGTSRPPDALQGGLVDGLKVSTGTDAKVFSVEVALAASGRCVTAGAEAAVSSSACNRLVAEATLSALSQLRGPGPARVLESVALVAVGEHEVALACLVDLKGTPSTGSAAVGPAGAPHAVACAVLRAGGWALVD